MSLRALHRRGFISANALLLLAAFCPGAWAQSPAVVAAEPAADASPAPAASGEATALPTIEVTAKHAKPRATAETTATPRAPASPAAATPYETGAPNVAGGTPVVPQLASQMTISGKDVNARPMTRPGEVVEVAPGLVAIDHSDGGKANQYYLRGYNLDHGTDMATFVDDVPINLPSHAHGQGYTDLNFLIPETIGAVDVRKGPYFADVGDFASAGDLHIGLRDSVDKNIESVTIGSFGYDRYLALGSTRAGAGSLLYAGEFNTYNGPWTNPDEVRKFSGLLRYSQGTATDGFSATAMAYSNAWNATDQVPLRAIATGQIGPYGALDPSDGGDAGRYSLSARFAQSDADGLWRANAYVVKYQMDLFNNYTWSTDDPANGDQFHQRDNRIYAGVGASRTIDGTLAGMPTETVFGVQSRYDDITTGLSDTVRRQLLTNILLDHVDEGNVGIYAESTVHWTDWLRTTAGWRGDYYGAAVNSMLQPANSGNDKAAIGSPKFTAVFGPFDKTELFVGTGMGYHSNDARSTTLTEVPGDPAAPQGASPLLVRSRGAEIGVRTKAIANLDSSISFFYLHQDSELFFDGDTGNTTAGPPSRRMGIEVTNDYRLASWLHVDSDLALSRARFVAFDSTQAALYQSLSGFPQAQIGSAPGNFVYNAPWMVASAGITLGEQTGWFSALRWRYISSRPLTEDGVFQSPPFDVVNGELGYRFDNGWRIQLDALNLLNSTADQATYAYGSLLTTDSLFGKCFPATTRTAPTAVCQNGVMDYVLHPLEPLALRLTVAGPVDTIDIPAMAAELRRAIPAYSAPAANYDWTGFYIGGHVDVGRSRSNGDSVDAATGAAMASAADSMSAWHGGVQVGFDVMMPSRVVIGVSADISSGSTRTATIADASGTSTNQETVFDRESVRGRFGYAVDNLLLYGIGGWAWSSDQVVRTQLVGTFNNATAGTAEAANKYLGGWTAGGGVALAFAQNWNAFAEYRRTGFGTSTVALPFSQLSTTSTTAVNTLTLGVNYKFNWARRTDPR